MLLKLNEKNCEFARSIVKSVLRQAFSVVKAVRYSIFLNLHSKVVFLYQSLIFRKMSKAEIYTSKGVMKVSFYDQDARRNCG